MPYGYAGVLTKMLTKRVRYTFNRGGYYYFTRRVPTDLQKHYLCPRIVQGLNTKCSSTAKTRALVAVWHIADIDKAIDALGDAVAGYDRDGLRAVTNLGGVGAMKQFVRTKGEYNPADELGTSLHSYYDKFRQRGGV